MTKKKLAQMKVIWALPKSKKWYASIRALTGRTDSLEIRKKKSDGQKRIVAEGRHNFWKGGITKTNQVVRMSFEYKIWRESVFSRDNWTCQECGVRGGHLNADHIKPFSLYPDLRLDVSNGRTLCLACHRKTPTFAKRYDLLVKQTL